MDNDKTARLADGAALWRKGLGAWADLMERGHYREARSLGRLFRLARRAGLGPPPQAGAADGQPKPLDPARARQTGSWPPADAADSHDRE